MASDIDIARTITLKPIQEIGDKLGIDQQDLQMYGRYKAKIPLQYIQPEKVKETPLILVTAISPTPAGEGKTTMSIGLTEGMNRLGKKTCVVLREPSLGPVFGIKGGATGGGYAQVLPMEDINLHFTGDFSAVEKAHNLLAALIDNNIQSRKRSLGIDPRTVLWKRVMDMNDRALRDVIVGLGGTTGGVPRQTGFDITAASEIMAILCLSDNLSHLKEKIGNIFIGFTYDREPVFARDLHAPGAMAALMKDAIQPNLVQTIEGNPAIIHGGPFANIAQGTNTIIATRMGLSMADYVVTEAGFGADLGAEKFLDIKCRQAGLSPKTVVLVATIRALKYHGGADLKELTTPDEHAVAKGLPNMMKHLENIAQFGLPAVVAINRFPTDTDEEINVVKEHCRAMGVRAETVTAWADGGAGAEAIAEAVLEAIPKAPAQFKPIYSLDMSIEEKVRKVATTIYGANDVEFTSRARLDLRRIEKLGLSGLPVCIAKTQKSLSDNPDLIGRPTDFTITVREIEIAAGAGFVVPITGDMMRMPGLPLIPSAEGIDINDQGEISGLF
ncbi:MAG: formate--tetrahydrofolate ligase [Saprospiraceae bacterium]|nr:formate--tetrahydrofolate ligase [Saprospiraceae bacterium]MCB9311639.1 formate--tetrahydrofolate ligase [Lewinellaceae bacterium]